MILEPIELLQQRLNEINAIDCDEYEFKRHRTMYNLAILLLKDNYYYRNRDKQRKLNDFEVSWLKDNIKKGEKNYYAEIFKVSYQTIHRAVTKPYRGK